MSSTVPSYSPVRIWSPIRKGRRQSSSTPATKFWRMSFRAKPMATELIPSPVTRSRQRSEGKMMTLVIASAPSMTPADAIRAMRPTNAGSRRARRPPPHDGAPGQPSEEYPDHEAKQPGREEREPVEDRREEPLQ